jgi:lysyl-tRNA synthetase class 2
VPTPAAAARALRVERHPLGPRCYVLGLRVHECFVGIGLLAAAALAVAVHLHPPFHVIAALAALGGWMVVKDWRDFFPSLRDRAAWSAGVHRPRMALRAVRRGDRLPGALGLLAVVAALVNVASALTPDLAERTRMVRGLVPPDVVPAAHALVLPAGAALIVVALNLARRRRRAWALATGLLVILGVLDLVKGLDVEEAAFSLVLAGLLIWGRDAFHVRTDRQAPLRALRRAPAILGGAFALALVAVWAGRGEADAALPWRAIPGEAIALLTGTGGARYSGEFAWLPVGVGLIGVGALVAVAALAFRAATGAASPPTAATRAIAARLVRAHGADTLSYFKLRRDLQYLVGRDGSSFLGYRVEGRVLLVAGEPVGPPGAMKELVRDLVEHAEARGLRIAVVGAGAPLLDLWRQAGLRPFYIGDEAIVDTGAFTLAGRPIRKVRQSVARLEREGFTAELCELGSLDEACVAELRAVSERWRRGAPERGFSMAMDDLGGEGDRDSVVLVARDGGGRARGFLQFVPCFGRPAMSLAAMRWERGTPNGLSEFMVVRSIEAMRDRGVLELSLNFAFFARLMHAAAGPVERTLAAIGRAGGAWFQIESLYRFNAKFLPRWEPRYLLYEGALGLPRAGLAALRAEGQLPRTRLAERAARLLPTR